MQPPRRHPPVAQRLSDVHATDLCRSIEVGDGARDAADAVPTAGGQVQTVRGLGQQLRTLGIRGGDVIQYLAIGMGVDRHAAGIA